MVAFVETEQYIITYRLKFLNSTFFFLLMQLNLGKTVLKPSAAWTNFTSNCILSVTLLEIAY